LTKNRIREKRPAPKNVSVVDETIYITVIGQFVTDIESYSSGSVRISRGRGNADRGAVEFTNGADRHRYYLNPGSVLYGVSRAFRSDGPVLETVEKRDTQPQRVAQQPPSRYSSVGGPVVFRSRARTSLRYAWPPAAARARRVSTNPIVRAESFGFAAWTTTDFRDRATFADRHRENVRDRSAKNPVVVPARRSSSERVRPRAVREIIVSSARNAIRVRRPTTNAYTELGFFPNTLLGTPG